MAYNGLKKPIKPRVAISTYTQYLTECLVGVVRIKINGNYTIYGITYQNIGMA